MKILYGLHRYDTTKRNTMKTSDQCRNCTELVENGHLIDVSMMAAEAGLISPTYISKEAWLDCVEWSAEDSKVRADQDQDGRLWDVLAMSKLAFVRAKQRDYIPGVPVIISRVPRDGVSREAQPVKLCAMVGPSDVEDRPAVFIDLASEYDFRCDPPKH